MITTSFTLSSLILQFGSLQNRVLQHHRDASVAEDFCLKFFSETFAVWRCKDAFKPSSVYTEMELQGKTCNISLYFQYQETVGTQIRTTVTGENATCKALLYILASSLGS